MCGVSAGYFGDVWCFSVDNSGDPQALSQPGAGDGVSAADGFGADGWGASPDFKTACRCGVVERWPACLELLHLAQNVLSEILDRVVVGCKLGVGSELDVQPFP